MNAVVQERYGSPDVLELRDVEVPVIGDDGVLVRVRASSVNAADWHTMRGRPIFARFMTGARRPKQAVAGTDVAGVVEAVGRGVVELRPGDEVFGGRNGAFAEFVAGRVRNFVPKPPQMSFEEAAAIPVAATTALQALRDRAEVKAGQRVLIIGAGGGVGSFCVEIAKAFGAMVTATTSPANVEFVRSLGADEVVDYTSNDVTRGSRRFDVVLDVGGYASFGDLARVANPGGAIVPIGAGKATTVGIIAGLVAGEVRRRVLGQRLRFFLAQITRDDLLVLARLATEGKLIPRIDRRYALAETADAMRYAESGVARGKVVITV
ncbi:MAG: NAD(P)-dependent alcohol dehydrogenase [Chloroflexi bacterium]|nr:NAD(P)-dependent alcohol dehydrogenase [Chloroflexota bacterium]